MSYSAVGQVWDPQAFRNHLRTVDLSWAKGITLHHTASPSLAQRPKGFTIQHIRNMQHYYQNSLGWSRGPHLFTDDDQIFGMSPLSERGIHARSFNRTHIGIEVLGNYDTEGHSAGRGLACWRTTAEAVAALLDRMGKSFSVVNFHRDDPKTSKTCPGKPITKQFVQSLMTAAPAVSDREDDPGDLPPIDREEMLKRIDAVAWQLKKLKELAR